MALGDRITELQKTGTDSPVEANSEIEEVINTSSIEKLMDEVGEIANADTERVILENGERVVFTSRWPDSETKGQNQISVSVRQESISFIGDSTTDQFIRLRQEAMYDQEKLEVALAQTFLNPLRTQTLR